jgi:sarcosine oxidase subunit beta
MELPRSAPVVVIGGGVIGTSIAFHLAEAGVPGVLLIERDQLGAGSTSKAAGGIRAQFSDPTNVAISMRSLDLFDDFARRPGYDIDFRRVGYLFLLSDDASVAEFTESITLQNSMGVESRLLTPDEAAAKNPLVDTTGIVAAAWCPTDALATPDSVVAGYARAARQHGATLATGIEVTGIERAGATIAAVRAGPQVVETECVICAAGAWSAAIGAMAGVQLDVTPVRREVLFTGPVAGLRPDLPMTIDFATSFYFHPEGPGVLIGFSDPSEPAGFHLDTTADFTDRIAPLIARRAPALLDAEVRGGWAGLYEVTPDHNGLIGEADIVRRFLYATGFSGHGFQQGPAVGEILRDLYLGHPPAIDVTAMSADRFSAQELRPEFNIV